MKEIKILILFSLLFSCDSLNTEPRETTTSGAGSETNVQLIQREDSKVLIYIEKGINLQDSEIEYLRVEWLQAINFIETKFKNPTIFEDENGEKIDPKEMSLYITNEKNEALRGQLKSKEAKILIFKKDEIKSFDVIQKILELTFIKKAALTNEKDLYTAALNNAFYNMIPLQILWNRETKKKDELRELSHPYGFLNISYELLNEIALSRLQKHNSLGYLHSFVKNLIHLMNLCHIAKMGIYRAIDKETSKKRLGNFLKFIDDFKTEKKLIVEEDIFEETQRILLEEHKIYNTKFEKDHTLNYYPYALYVYDSNIFFVQHEFPDINTDWLNEYAKQLPQNDPNRKRHIFIEIHKEKYADKNELPNEIHLELCQSTLNITDQEFFFTEIDRLQVEKKIKSLKATDFNPLLRTAYSKFTHFSEKNLELMDLEKIVNSSHNFLALLNTKTVSQSKITTLEELINFPQSDILLNLSKPPNRDELKFFLKNSNETSLQLQKLSDFEVPLKNFLHFHHLLTSTRIVNQFKDMDNRLYEDLRSKLEKLLENPLAEITEDEFLEQMTVFFKPFDFLMKKLEEFWKYKHQLSGYMLDYYNIGKIYSDSYIIYNEESLNLESNSTGDKPFIFLKPNKLTMNSLLYFSIPHEVGHHLQFSCNFWKSFDYNLDKANCMGSELEANMFAGFFTSHEEGLNLSQEQFKAIRKFVGTRGDGFDNFEDEECLHGLPSENEKAYGLGQTFARVSFKKETIDSNTPQKLHEEFKKIFRKTNYLKNYPEKPKRKAVA